MHTPWGARLEDVLASIGIAEPDRRLVQAYQHTLCYPAARSPKLKLSDRVQAVLLAWGVGGPEQYALLEYLDTLNTVAGEVITEVERQQDTARHQSWRDKNHEAYNAYQRQYMRGYRDKKKAIKELTKAPIVVAFPGQTALNTRC